MINEEQAKKYCREDLSMIYGYDEAIADNENYYEIHHTLGLVYSVKELIEKGLYYNQPAEYLMFVTRSQHKILHNIRGVKGSLKGVPLTEEARRKISEIAKLRTGEKNPMFGKHHSEETRKKLSEANKGKTGEKHPRSKPVNQIDKQTGDVIKTWPCTYEVERILGIHQSGISACCKGKTKYAGGFVWRYAE